MIMIRQADSAKSTRPKVALVSTSVPPSPTGQARVIGHLFSECQPDNCMFLTDDINSEQVRESELSIAKCVHFPAPNLHKGPLDSTWKNKLKSAEMLYAEIRKRADLIVANTASFSPDVLVACTASRVDLPASWWASRALRVPLVAYLFDDPIMQWNAGRDRVFASLMEAVWSKTARAIVTPNEGMSKVFYDRRRILPTVIRNPVSPKAFGRPNYSMQSGSPVRLVYTGSIYGAQADAVLNVQKVLDSYKGAYELHIYTPQSEDHVLSLGIQSPFISYHAYMDSDEIYDIQKNADILFLPLAFDRGMRAVLQTAAPQKMGEYLASGRPILVHAPADTFVANFFKANHAGVVVDQPSSEDLVAALNQIRDNELLRKKTIDSAQIVAEEFSIEVSRSRFWEIVQKSAFSATKARRV
jgi:glycosyltransferase involved in cell wall biosynthesis